MLKGYTLPWCGHSELWGQERGRASWTPSEGQRKSRNSLGPGCSEEEYSVSERPISSFCFYCCETHVCTGHKSMHCLLLVSLTHSLKALGRNFMSIVCACLLCARVCGMRMGVCHRSGFSWRSAFSVNIKVQRAVRCWHNTALWEHRRLPQQWVSETSALAARRVPPPRSPCSRPRGESLGGCGAARLYTNTPTCLRPHCSPHLSVADETVKTFRGMDFNTAALTSAVTVINNL